METFKDIVEGYLGYRVRDCVTELEGIVTSVSFDLYGCTQCVVHPGLDNEGVSRDSLWYDINRLKIISDDPVMISPHISKKESVSINKFMNNGPSDKPSYKA